ncbi:unnamed protein product [Closterium sp. NIES-54]
MPHLCEKDSFMPLILTPFPLVLSPSVNNPGITLPMVYHLESVGYLLYHVEPNAQHPDCCIELAFIHQSLLQPWGTSRSDFERWKKARGK